jgi:hypothetical protein
VAEAGATTPQIASVSGHSIESCQKILDVYLPCLGDIALGAILAWEQQIVRAESKFVTPNVLETVLETGNFEEKSA